MSRVGSVARTVPQGAWTAVCALVLIASLGFAVVLGAGLSVWTEAVGSRARPVTPVVAPPGSGLVVVPGTHARVRHPVTTTGAPPGLAVAPLVHRAPAPAPRRVPAPEPSRVPGASHQPTPTPSQPQTPPQQVPGGAQVPPPVVAGLIVVQLHKHDLVDKLTHALADLTDPVDESQKDQAELLEDLSKSVAKGDATVLSPAPAQLPDALTFWGPGKNDDGDSAAAPGLTVVSVSQGASHDAPAIAVLTAATPAQPTTDAAPMADTQTATAVTSPADPAVSAGPAAVAPSAADQPAVPPASQPVAATPAKAPKPDAGNEKHQPKHAHKAKHARARHR